MTRFALNLLFLLFWLVLTEELTATNTLLGFLVGYLFLYLVRPLMPETNYFEKIPGFIRFLIFYFKELVLSNLVVAYDVLTPWDLSEPEIVGIPLDAKSDLEIAVLMNLITLTPGTLSMDLSEDRKTLFVHGMFVRDTEKFRKQIKEEFERRVMELMR